MTTRCSPTSAGAVCLYELVYEQLKLFADKVLPDLKG